jgi:hypothetical protein
MLDAVSIYKIRENQFRADSEPYGGRSICLPTVGYLAYLLELLFSAGSLELSLFVTSAPITVNEAAHPIDKLLLFGECLCRNWCVGWYVRWRIRWRCCR